VIRIRADFHTHSIGEEVFGPRAEGLVERHIEAAAEVGLDCIAVTDHNDLRPGLLTCAYGARVGHRVLIIPGMELTTEERIHLVAIGLSEPIEPWRPLAETIARIREAGAISILPHPFFAHLRARRDIDAIERFNAQYGDFDLNGTSVPQVANSDSHSADDLRRSTRCTIVEVDSVCLEDVVAAIRAGRTTPV
jgi:predicted metal-dependent phosphoesterase TrpH